MKYKSGGEYDGEWIGGFREGRGKEKSASGGEYDGEFKDNN